MRLALIHSQQPGNQYAGGATGQADSEQAWMRRLALAVAPLLTAAGVDVEVSPLGTSYASNVAWVNGRHRVKPFDLLVSFHSNAMGDSCILYGRSKASRGYAEAFQRVLNAARIMPAGDGWEFNERKVAEVADTEPPAVLLEWHRHDTLAGAAWLRQRINDGTLAADAARAILAALGVKEPAPTPVEPVVSAPGLARIASVNLAQREHMAAAAAAWLGGTLRASAYLLQEADLGMVVAIAKGLGWTDSPGRPCYRVDENRNAVVWDPRKWRDLRSKAVSLTETADDLGDRHYRSVQWAELEHRATGTVVWLGSSHLSNGDSAESAAARAAQARVLAAHLPEGRLALGIDRNSRGTSEPTRILAAAGLADLTVGASPLRTYPAGDTRTDGVQIDAIFGRGVALRSVRLVDPGSVTDHRAWVATLAIPADLL